MYQDERSGTPTVYLLHFDTPYHHARHYVGYTASLRRRLAKHRAGTGARLLAVITAAGIGFQLARVWRPGDRRAERRIKDGMHGTRACPICRGRRGLCEICQDRAERGVRFCTACRGAGLVQVSSAGH